MEFTNTFEGGMKKDPNILLQPRGTYRDMNNGTLVSYDGNHYVVELPKGTSVSFTIDPIYNGVYTAKAGIPTPMGFISFLDKLVVFSTNSQTPGYGEIGTVTIDRFGVGTYTPVYNHPSLNFSIAHQITGFTFTENDRIARVYWTDYFNEPMSLNVNDPAFTPIVSGSLVNGQEYMVVGGAVTYSAVNYGPGLTAGNIFTATATTTYTALDGNPLVYKYIPYQLLPWSPDRINPYIDFDRYIAGSLYGGSKTYFVRLSNKSNGVQTAWSYGTFPINVYDIAAYASYNLVQGTGANATLTSSNTGIRIKVSGIDPYYDTIELACAQFDKISNTLDSANIVVKVPVTGPEMTIDHIKESVDAISLDDLTIFPATIFRVKDITTSKNFNIIGNIEERSELTDFSKSTATISDLTYQMPADNVSSIRMNAGIGKQSSTGVASGSLVAQGKYVVTTARVLYSGVFYGPNEPAGPYFTANINTAYVPDPGAVVKACILYSKYQTGVGNTQYKCIELNDDYFDYRGMASTQYLRQYWGKETYRMGVIPFDKKGNPMYVRWIGDHVVQSYSTKGGPTSKLGAYVSLQINGLRISGLTFSPSDIAKMSGFSIVRAPRDKQCLAQGIVFGTVYTAGDTIKTQPVAMPGNAEDTGRISNVVNWYSPDQLFSYSGFQGSSSGQVQGECFVTPQGGVYLSPSSNEYYSKFYEVHSNQDQTIKIQSYDVVAPGGSIAGYFVGLTYDNNLLHLSVANSFAPGAKAVGGQNVTMILNSDVLVSGVPIGDPTQDFNPAKILMNYKTPKSNLYGGTSEAALANTIYISTGHYQPINASVLADVFDGTNYVFNNVDVFGGDSFLGIMSYGHSLYDNVQYASDGSFSYGIFYPVESNANHYLRQGRNIQQYGMHGNAANGVYYDLSGTAHPEQFGMNDSYATDGSVIAYPALPVADSNAQFKYRIRWAGAKYPGETIDSFRIFLQNNYRDLDGNKGQINNVRERDNKVFYWQDHSVGYLPILERQVVSGALGEATQLGVGGVIDRFDTFNTYFGNQHKLGLTETEYGFAWFDFRRKAFLAMTVGGGVQEVSFVDGLQTFFNDPSNFNNGVEESYSLQFNDNPLIGLGMCGVYDPNYKMTYTTFKWIYSPDGMSAVNQEFTIAYYHPRNIFVGFFDIKGAIYHNFNNWVVGHKNIPALVIAPGTSYVIGDLVKKDNVEYSAIANFTTHTPVQSYEEPDAASSVYWVKTSQTNEVHALFNTLSFCKFFGYMYNHDITLVVNPPLKKPFTVDNFQQKSNENNYDVVYCETDQDSASDVTGGRLYKYRDNSWWSSSPLGSKGRLVDYYLLVKLTFNTYVNYPTNSRNLRKLFEFITSKFREKK